MLEEEASFDACIQTTENNSTIPARYIMIFMTSVVPGATAPSSPRIPQTFWENGTEGTSHTDHSANAMRPDKMDASFGIHGLVTAVRRSEASTPTRDRMAESQRAKLRGDVTIAPASMVCIREKLPVPIDTRADISTEYSASICAQ